MTNKFNLIGSLKIYSHVLTFREGVGVNREGGEGEKLIWGPETFMI